VSITPGVQRNDDSAILLTGATGFLGGEVLARLLEHGQRAVCALVRAHDQAGAQRRLDRVIDSLGLDRDAVGDRATAIAGDVTEPLLGLDTRSRAELAERTGRIIHCAASVSFTLGLDESRQINVGGTSRMLDLAEFCVRVGGGLDSFVHVSTAYVAGRHPEPFSEADLDRGQEFRNAYERSKFEAELAVAERAATLPVQVVRPSIVVGDSRTGWTSSFNVVYGPLRAFDRGAFPVLPARASAPVDIVPVDFVADAIVALAGRPRTTFNLTAGSRASSVGEIVELASAEAGRRPPRIVHPGIYRRAVHPLLVRTGGEVRRRALRRSEVYFPYFEVEAGFDAERTRAVLAPLGIEPPPLRAYFDRLMGFARAADWGKRELTRRDAAAALEALQTRPRRPAPRRGIPPRVPAPSQWGR
jgi:thioester reductase-like protein